MRWSWLIHSKAARGRSRVDGYLTEAAARAALEAELEQHYPGAWERRPMHQYNTVPDDIRRQLLGNMDCFARIEPVYTDEECHLREDSSHVEAALRIARERRDAALEAACTATLEAIARDLALAHERDAREYVATVAHSGGEFKAHEKGGGHDAP